MRAEKLPASEKSELPKACWSENWILESDEADSENLLREVVVVVVVVVVVEEGVESEGLGCECECPPSRPNSSSSRRSSSD